MKFKQTYHLFLIIVLLSQLSIAQHKNITMVKTNTSVQEILDYIEFNTQYNFIYKTKTINLERKVSLNIHQESIDTVLNKLFEGTGIKHIIKGHQIILRSPQNMPFGDSQEEFVNIVGKVVDENNKALAGVIILEKGTKKGTVTDFDGTFSLEDISPDSQLIFSHLGYHKLELQIEKKNYLSVTLLEDTEELEQVVVIGYGLQKKSDVTGAISSITKKDLDNNVFTSFAQMLQGRASGLQVIESSGEPGAYVSVNIRGANTLFGNSDPLYILDGIPLSLGTEAENDHFWTSTNPLASISPNDIEHIEVLKDASATAIYGSRASNGVILITTKTAQPGKAMLNAQIRTSVLSAGIPYKLMNAEQYNLSRNDLVQLSNPNFTYEELLNNGDIPYPNIDVNGKGTDFMSAIFKPAIMKNYALSFSGGSERFSQLISMNFDNQEGVIIDSKFNRGNFRYNSNMVLSDYFSFKTNVQLNYIRNQRVLTSTKTGLYGVVFNAMRIDPNIPLRDNVGDLNEIDENGDFVSNPFINAINQDNVLKNKDIIGGLSTELKITNNLIFNTRLGINHRIGSNVALANKSSTLGRRDNGRLSNGDLEHTSATLESFFNYENTFNNHKVTGLLGVGYEDFTTKRAFHVYTDFTFDDLGPNAIQLAHNPQIFRSEKTNYTIHSGFFRFGYIFKNKYLLTLNGRADGTSKFAKGNRWRFFPSMALAWVINKESVFKNLEDLNHLKLRLSYGETGSQFGVDPLATQNIFSIGRIALADDNLYTAAFPSGIPNKSLTWETSKTLNLGLDFGIFKNRITGSLEYYNRKTDRLLTQLQIPAQTGFNSVSVNAGELNNRGIEVSLDVKVVQNERFKWNSKVNWSSGKTKIINLGSNPFIDSPNLSANFFTVPGSRSFIGDEIGLFYGYKVNGLIQVDDLEDYENGDFSIRTGENGEPLYASIGDNRPGTWIFDDANSDGIINIEDRQIIGNPNPDFFFGWNNNFTVGSFDISLFFQGSYGNDVLNLNKAFTGIGWPGGNASQEWFEKRWTLNNQHNNVKWPNVQAVNAVTIPNSVYVEDGSYIRLKNLAVRYHLPLKKNAAKLALSFTATNLFTLTNYGGIDPEVDTYNGNPLLKGVDFSAFPRPKMYSLGLDLSF